MNWKALLVEAVIMALTTFATVFFREWLLAIPLTNISSNFLSPPAPYQEATPPNYRTFQAGTEVFSNRSMSVIPTYTN